MSVKLGSGHRRRLNIRDQASGVADMKDLYDAFAPLSRPESRLKGIHEFVSALGKVN
jgi:hypothetical protein